MRKKKKRDPSLFFFSGMGHPSPPPPPCDFNIDLLGPKRTLLASLSLFKKGSQLGSPPAWLKKKKGGRGNERYRLSFERQSQEKKSFLLLLLLPPERERDF